MKIILKLLFIQLWSIAIELFIFVIIFNEISQIQGYQFSEADARLNFTAHLFLNLSWEFVSNWADRHPTQRGDHFNWNKPKQILTPIPIISLIGFDTIVDKPSSLKLFCKMNINIISASAMGVLAPGSAHVRPSARPPIDTSEF